MSKRVTEKACLRLQRIAYGNRSDPASGAKQWLLYLNKALQICGCAPLRARALCDHKMNNQTICDMRRMYPHTFASGAEPTAQWTALTSEQCQSNTTRTIFASEERRSKQCKLRPLSELYVQIRLDLHQCIQNLVPAESIDVHQFTLYQHVTHAVQELAYCPGRPAACSTATVQDAAYHPLHVKGDRPGRTTKCFTAAGAGFLRFQSSSRSGESRKTL